VGGGAHSAADAPRRQRHGFRPHPRLPPRAAGWVGIKPTRGHATPSPTVHRRRHSAADPRARGLDALGAGTAPPRARRNPQGRARGPYIDSAAPALDLPRGSAEASQRPRSARLNRAAPQRAPPSNSPRASPRSRHGTALAQLGIRPWRGGPPRSSAAGGDPHLHHPWRGDTGVGEPVDLIQTQSQRDGPAVEGVEGGGRAPETTPRPHRERTSRPALVRAPRPHTGGPADGAFHSRSTCC